MDLNFFLLVMLNKYHITIDVICNIILIYLTWKLILSIPVNPMLSPSLLSDPFLQFPTETSVRVVWFTDFSGSNHRVIYGENLEQSSEAHTTKLSQMREDQNSKLNPGYSETTKRDIWRHEALVTGLISNQRLPYQAISIDNQSEIKSSIFTLSPSPQPGTSLKILLTSDHQLMPMVAANLQKVVETVGQVDAVFMAGDLVNVPDRTSEWFDDLLGGSFFPCLQGRANYVLEKEGIKTIYQGGQLIQNAPLFPTIGNHEIMGRFSQEQSLNEQFENSFPRQQAEILYHKIAENVNPEADTKIAEAWLKDNSFNTDTYEEIFSLPGHSSGTKKYYAVTFGDIRLVVIYVTNMWRSPRLEPQIKGRYQEREEDLNNPENWGYGQHIFGEIGKGSPQYQWLEQELNSTEFQQAKYKIVMLHHPPHTLGGNIVPPYTQPIPKIKYDSEGKIQSIRYDYPQEKDYIIQDLIPLLESARVQLVFFGHSHLWNRFISSQGMHFLESSNVGNSYGAHWGDNQRPIPPDTPNYNTAITGDPNGLEPVLPSIAPLIDENHQPLPYIASNDITVFSILDTRKGTVSSYRFDTRQPDSAVIKFDEFAIGN
jgi:hypothetical protein